MERWLPKIFTLIILLWSGSLTATPLSSDYAATPPLLSKTSSPLVMLAMSVDHALFKKAYSDYTDLDGDGSLDTSYNDAFDYLGYFDSNWCYQYSSGKYSPSVQASGSNQHHCTTSPAPWSGNFLNWASMSRMDVLRKVLYGGKRSTDSTNKTVLERAYLPKDVHAFVKVYNSNNSGIDTANYTPYSDTTISFCSVSASENGTPLLRVAKGGWPRWASKEGVQCQWGGFNSPASNQELNTYNARVETCVSGKDATNASRCQQYPDGNSKPFGLLQKYGESGAVRFGLLTGSYDKNISGGLLRKNIGKIAGNDNNADDEVDLATGQFTSAQGIIHNIDQFRITKYDYGQNKYTDCNTYGISVSSFKSNRGTSSSKRCSNWGNPLSEIYLEALRYFAGKTTPTNSFDTSMDAQFIPGITRVNWDNPMNADNACANCSIILLSTGLNSFDADELSSSADLPGLSGASSVSSKTDAVGNMEYNGSFAGHYLVGGIGSERHCSSKYLTGLSQAVGLCPEIPQLEGGYQIAGLAWYANTSDLRTELTGKQSVRTYAIELAESMPNFTLDVNGKALTFQPVCQTSSNFGSGSGEFSGSGSDCSLIDVVVESLVKDDNGKVVEASLLFVWEDSLWGNDYDFDAASRIKFCVGSHCNQLSGAPLKTVNFTDDEVRIAIQVDDVDAGLNLRFSYTLTGANSGDDGLQTSSFVYKLSSGSYPSSYVVKDFVASGVAASVLPKPMFLAAKYGGYFDLDGDGTPGHDGDGNGAADEGDSREWDNRSNHTGSLGADGFPDNYYFSRNPSLLETQLNQVLSDISNRVSSATNAALFANSSTGIGALYQALFQPEIEVGDNKVQWGGILHSIFVDSKGHLREDGNGNDKLDDYSTDKIVTLFFDPNAGQTMVQRFSSNDNGVSKTVDGILQPLNSLKTIWDARKQLSQLTNVTSQRSYDSLASGGRHILTWMDTDSDAQIDADEVKPLVSSSFVGAEGYLGVSSTEADSVVNYVRGQEMPGTRSRTIDFDGDGLNDIWRLGDVIHSTPRLISAPDSQYDGYYKDNSYRTFRNQYLNRRHVLYVGANDGFIHAFNSGFWKQSEYSYELNGDNGEVQHPLGSELWAYAPMNLLPHLKWLKEVDYPHVYYMDGEPLVFDANIFTPDNDHPDGWGTVLVMGMRFGGGDIDVSINGSTKTMRSAYIVLDVTNPEDPPKVLAEITHPDLGFTSSLPTLVKMRQAGTTTGGAPDWSNPIRNDWYLVFGSGPAGSDAIRRRQALDEGKSDQNLRVFAYDLKSNNFVSGLNPLVTEYSASFAGDMKAVDWNQDYIDDAVYFGSIETGGNQLSGRLLRLQLNNLMTASSLKVLLDTDKPIVASPLTIRDKESYWVYSGTGRLMTVNDNKDASSQMFFGVQEPLDSTRAFTYATISGSSLVDTSSVEVLTNGTVRVPEGSGYKDFSVGTDSVDNFEALKTLMKNQLGWKRTLRHDGVNPSGRNINKSTRLFSLVLFAEYEPPADSCSIDGSSYLYGLHYQTGTAKVDGVLGSVSVTDINAQKALDRISLGAGFASSPVVHQGESGRLTVVTQGAGGSITSDELKYVFSSEGRQSWWQMFDIPWTDE
ncbi:hypothetical protein ACH42_16010 [Endozoicomonas sp. (ex Bugula neritina AB1)]|nr:hypothetical protein ACH42_16010 [Endozoicomonas sp. (ex Bugula neritina AB1)]